MSMSQRLDSIQKLIITLHRNFFDESPSPMKLQKLCYYVQGYMIAQGITLFDEDFQAWQHGPVIPALYQRYKDYGWRGITEEVDIAESAFDEDTYAEIGEIVAAYGRYDGAALSTMTHREMPWMDARQGIAENEGSNATITKVSLARFFETELARQ